MLPGSVLMQAQPISGPHARVFRLEQVLAEHRVGSLPHVLATAELAARTGKPAIAKCILHDVLDRHWSELQENQYLFASALCVALAALAFDTAAAMINRRCGTGDWFSVGVEEGRDWHADVVCWKVDR